MNKMYGFLLGVTYEDLELLEKDPTNFWEGVNEIGFYAFKDFESLESIVIPNGVERIYEEAFEGCCGLKMAAIPNSVTYIGKYVFEYCRKLKSIVIPDSVTEIGSGAFSYCESLKKIVIPNSVTKIGTGIFVGCRNLESVVIPDCMTEIERFGGCDKLKSINIPLSVQSIDMDVFEKTRLKKDGEIVIEYEKGKFAKVKYQDLYMDKWVEEHKIFDRLALEKTREVVKEKVQNGELKEVPDPRIEVSNAKKAIANVASCVPPTKGKTTTKKEVEEPRLNKLTTKKDEKDPRDR